MKRKSIKKHSIQYPEIFMNAWESELTCHFNSSVYPLFNVEFNKEWYGIKEDEIKKSDN